MSGWVSLSRAIAHPSSFGQAGRTTHVETVCQFSTAGSVSRTRMPEFSLSPTSKGNVQWVPSPANGKLCNVVSDEHAMGMLKW